MSFVDVPAASGHAVNLDLPEAERWRDVIRQELAVTRATMAEAREQLRGVPAIAGTIFAALYRIMGGRYRAELSAWADALGIPFGTFTAINCGYELDHAYHALLGLRGHRSRHAGCTNGICWLEGRGMAHVRTLDWPILSLAAATRCFTFTRGGRDLFTAVGFPGQVGVLSGLVAGRYSVTIDWAPPSGLVNFDFAPSFLLRETLETCDTFDAAVRKLAETPLSTSVFYIVCGVERNQACVIERRKREHVVRRMTEPVLAQANHFAPALTRGLDSGRPENPDPRNAGLARYVADGDYVAGSTFLRYDAMQRALASLAGTSAAVADLWRAIDPDPVTNPETCHRMIFFPGSGELHVQRRVPALS